MSRRRSLLAACLPAFGAVVCLALAPLCPLDSVWGHVAQAGLLTAPVWLVAAGLPWALLVAAWSRRWEPLLVGLLPLPLAGVPDLDGPPADGSATSGLRFVSANVNSFPDRDDPEALRAALAALRPDMLITIEQRGRDVPGMVRAADNFQVPVSRISHHSAVYCRAGLECEAQITEEIGSPSMKMPVALARVWGLCAVGVHGPPPAPKDPTGLLPYMAAIAERLSDGRLVVDWGPCLAGDRAVVLGDFNAVVGSRAYRMLTSAGFDDPERGRGIWATSWPAGGGWIDLPVFRLDHVLARGVDVAVIGRERVPGSDHKALVVSVAVAPSSPPPANRTRQ